MKKKLTAMVSALILTVALALSGLVTPTAGTAEAAGYGASIVQCTISGSNVAVVASASSVPASDDGLFYLVQVPLYAAGLNGNVVAQAPAGAQAAFSVPLNKGQANSALLSRFVVAVKQGGQLVQASEGCYVTNPEACASHTTGRTVTGKKGLCVDPNKIQGGELADLGIKQAIYNIPLANICGPTTNGSYPTINYSYNGKNYQFNGLCVAEYDLVFKTLTNKGIATTAVLLGNYTAAYADIIHPLARDGSVCPYYAFNTAEQAGAEHLAAIGSFLAQRYSNTGHGKVDNWVIGNEVTARTQWNYIAIGDLNTYAAEYAKAVRLFYNSIKSENGQANIYVSIDQQWDRNRNDPGNFDGRDLLTAFNASMSSQGNIDWGVACHPHPVPLTNAAFWANNAYYKNLVKHSTNSPFLTMENMEVLTDFLCQPAMVSPYGQVRSVICSEVGYPAAQGEQAQAAAVVFGYTAAASNQHIDAFLLTRQTDTPAEIAQGLPHGLDDMSGNHRLAYEYYKNADGPNAAAYVGNASTIMGYNILGAIQAR
ncbi:MAG: DUF5722 domain-containing protein [Lachnospiraceae bacterium]|nr:DUF5722 domain-containing protein [Lachnospiraceae bacterium]